MMSKAGGSVGGGGHNWHRIATVYVRRVEAGGEAVMCYILHIQT